ncbi:MAG: hypothetical protein ABIU63_07845 [Chitinophagaceae bacterium]
MNTIEHFKLRHQWVVLFMLFTAFAFQSCSGTKKIAFSTSSVVPAAEGSVKIKKDNNSNYDIDLNVMHLADPKRLSPPGNVYVVWMETNGNGIKNIGQIKTSDTFLSSTLKSALHTKTTFKPTAIFITAEDKPDIVYPGSTVVMRTTSFSVK